MSMDVRPLYSVFAEVDGRWVRVGRYFRQDNRPDYEPAKAAEARAYQINSQGGRARVAVGELRDFRRFVNERFADTGEPAA